MRKQILLITLILISIFAFAEAPYVDLNKFQQFEFTIGSEYILPAAVTIPVGLSSFPLVLIVQGSGEAGIDNLVGDNATIRDIAQGLSANGIATFRNAKRNGIYRDEFETFDYESVDAEFVEDALNAFESARKVPGVDGIFLLGVSMGGYMLPEIADRIAETYGQKVDGLILCASGIGRTPAPLVMFEQIRGQMQLAGYAEEQIKESEQVWQSVANRTIGGTIMIHPSMQASYVYRIMDSDAYGRLQATELPVLVLQGNADRFNYPVFFEELKEDFGDKENLFFRLYENINHRLMQKEYDDLYADLFKKGYVAEAIINDIVEFVLKGGLE